MFCSTTGKRSGKSFFFSLRTCLLGSTLGSFNRSDHRFCVPPGRKVASNPLPSLPKPVRNVESVAMLKDKPSSSLWRSYTRWFSLHWEGLGGPSSFRRRPLTPKSSGIALESVKAYRFCSRTRFWTIFIVLLSRAIAVFKSKSTEAQYFPRTVREWRKLPNQTVALPSYNWSCHWHQVPTAI